MTTRARVLAVLACSAVAASAAHAMPGFSSWAPAINAEQVPGTSSELNTPSLDGCPIQSPDGLSLYMASNRPRFAGDTRTDLDIWVAHRESRDAPWGAPENVGAPINSTANDFCPTPVRGGGLFFVSNRAIEGACGGSDIYFANHNRSLSWSDPLHLACTSEGGPNSPLDEMGPSYVNPGKPSLYFSSGPDIYVSERLRDDRFGPAEPVEELNSAAADIQPNIRRDGREIVFASNRLAGDQDLWAATRGSVDDPWSAPVNLGSAVNTAANETRPALSWYGTTLYFGRAPVPGGPTDITEGSTDIFVTTRQKAPG
jgi:WD40-like Beta Propeller Repeat